MTNCETCKADCIFKGEKELKPVCRGYIPMTHADRIRAMSDEELAEDRVHSYISGNLQVWYGDFYGWEYIKRVAVERELKWLKQPVKEDAK